MIFQASDETATPTRAPKFLSMDAKLASLYDARDKTRAAAYDAGAAREEVYRDWHIGGIVGSKEIEDAEAAYREAAEAARAASEALHREVEARRGLAEKKHALGN